MTTPILAKSERTVGQCISYFSCCYTYMLDKEQLREERCVFAHSLRVYCGREGMGAGA